MLVRKTKHLMNLFEYIKLSQLRTSLEMLYLILKYFLLVMPQIFDGKYVFNKSYSEKNQLNIW